MLELTRRANESIVMGGVWLQFLGFGGEQGIPQFVVQGPEGTLLARMPAEAPMDLNKVFSMGIGDQIRIGGNVFVTLIHFHVEWGRVRLGFVAPQDVRIARQEVVGRKPKESQLEAKKPKGQGVPCPQMSRPRSCGDKKKRR